MDSHGAPDLADVRRIVATRLPDYPVRSLQLFGEGVDHLAYEVNGELIVRFSKEPDPARRTALVNREAGVLAVVAGVSPLPVPEPLVTFADHGCLAYRRLPGRALLDLPRDQRMAHAESIAVPLGEFLAVLHGIPGERFGDLVTVDDPPLDEWLGEATATYRTVAGQVPAAWRRSIDEFLATPSPAGGAAQVFSHNDLGIEHVLVDGPEWTVTGVIDWSDAAIVDPAYDFGLLYRDLGPAAMQAALRRYQPDGHDVAALTQRAVFYARCSVFEDLAYGLELRQDRYVHNSLAALAWLFPG